MRVVRKGTGCETGHDYNFSALSIPRHMEKGTAPREALAAQCG